MQYPTYCNNVERRAIEELLNIILNEGRTVSVHDGEEWTLKKSTDALEIKKALLSADIDNIRIRSAAGEYLGTFALMADDAPESEPLSVIMDYTVNNYCDSVMTEMSKRLEP